jgi:hypothetical protein
MPFHLVAKLLYSNNSLAVHETCCACNYMFDKLMLFFVAESALSPVVFEGAFYVLSETGT